MHLDWYDDAKNQTLKTLPDFINNLVDNYQHDYGTICHVMTASTIATIKSIDKTDQGGITGFQASCIMWEFIRRFNFQHNKTGLRIIDFDEMLYPQNEYRFKKVISNEIFEYLKNEAENKLENKDQFCSDEVVEHWNKIVSGQVPFGYEVKK